MPYNDSMKLNDLKLYQNINTNRQLVFVVSDSD